jgi:D-arginine dehydrogenase
MVTFAKARCLIIGSGFAGAATAYHLALQGVSDVVVVEQEQTPGVHSSGRNASMIRQLVADPALIPLTHSGAAFLRNPPSGWPVEINFRQNGSLLLGSGEGWMRLRTEAEEGRRLGLEIECWSRREALRRVPPLSGSDFEGAAWCPTDGVIDIHACLRGYIEASISLGSRVLYGCRVSSIESRGGRVTRVGTNKGWIQTEVVVNAAGAWASVIGKMAGALPISLRPCRRHLFFTGPLDWVDPDWPFVWDVTHDVYFRPDSGGLLLCACDQDEMHPGIPPTDDSVASLLADKLKRYLPEFSKATILRSQAGFRTLTADGRFVIGRDPGVGGFFWVAGMGGHGVTASWAVGKLASSLIIHSGSPEEERLSPARFIPKEEGSHRTPSS